jgi:hypothetical protein
MLLDIVHVRLDTSYAVAQKVFVMLLTDSVNAAAGSTLEEISAPKFPFARTVAPCQLLRLEISELRS